MFSKSVLSLGVAVAALMALPTTKASAFGLFGHCITSCTNTVAVPVQTFRQRRVLLRPQTHTVHHSPAVYANVQRHYVVNRRVKIRDASTYVTTTPTFYQIQQVQAIPVVAAPVIYGYGYGYGYGGGYTTPSTYGGYGGGSGGYGGGYTTPTTFGGYSGGGGSSGGSSGGGGYSGGGSSGGGGGGGSSGGGRGVCAL
jgi:hypothetical protein